MKKYTIWNKIDPVLTPAGEIFTAEQWIERYPIASLPTITVICSAGEINGGFFGTLGQLVEMYAAQGCVFTDDMTPEEMLAAIEVFDEEKAATEKAKAEEKAALEEVNTMSLASIAAQLEFQNMMSLPDVEEE